MAVTLHLPTVQNWSCHNCGGCCRQHLIEITEEERQRINSQGWTAEHGVPAGRSAVKRLSAWWQRRRYRLAHQPNGDCVFLDENKLCRIHARFGEAAKPLACRIYPYAFHPAGNSVTVGLRYSCPSVVANRGRSVTAQQPDLAELVRLAVPTGAERLPPPRINAVSKVEWAEFHQLNRVLEDLLCDLSVPLLLRVQRVLVWTSLLQNAAVSGLVGAEFRQFVSLLKDTVCQDVVRLPAEIAAPQRTEQLYFRLQVALFARKDTVADLNSGWRGRWDRLTAILSFIRGVGSIPPLQTGWSSVPFDALELPVGPWPAGVGELLTRYFRVKVQGLHFCGRAHFDFSFVDGVQSMVMMLPIVCWLARWRAASLQHQPWQQSDFEDALAQADHHFAYSPALSQGHVLRRQRWLVQQGGLFRLARYWAR
jgi:lysine-N-methylase